jgi:hypothetical protein
MSQIVINKGSDLNFELQWKNSDSTPFDLTGYTVTAYDLSIRTMAITLTVTSAVNGTISGRLEWNDVYVGTKKGIFTMIFRIKISNGTDDITTPPITIYVQ